MFLAVKQINFISKTFETHLMRKYQKNCFFVLTNLNNNNFNRLNTFPL